MKKVLMFMVVIVACLGFTWWFMSQHNTTQVKDSDITWDRQNTNVVKVYGIDLSGSIREGNNIIDTLLDTKGHKYYQDNSRHLFTSYNDAYKSIQKYNKDNKIVINNDKPISEDKILRDPTNVNIVKQINGENVSGFGGTVSSVAGWVSQSGRRYYADAHNIYGKGKSSNSIWATLKASQLRQFPKGACFIDGKWVANK